MIRFMVRHVVVNVTGYSCAKHWIYPGRKKKI